MNFGHSMVDRNIAHRDTLLRRNAVRFLNLITRVLAALAFLVLCALPLGWLDRHHVLPGQVDMLLFVFLAPAIIVWMRVGSALLVVVAVCELTLLSLKPQVRRARIEAMAAVGVCALAVIYIYLAKRFNFH